MPMFRQGSTGNYVGANATPNAVTPIAGARAGTVNDAGGLKTGIDARGYKSATLYCFTGVLGTSVDAKATESATSGGTYTDVTGGAVATGIAGEIHRVDFDINPAKPFLGIVLVQVGATAVGTAWIELNNPMATNRP